METSLIDVDLHPIYVRIDIKGKITQFRFPCEIVVEQSKVKRSQTTGALQILMPKLQNTLVPYYFTKEELTKSSKEESLASVPEEGSIRPIQPSELLLSAPKNPEAVDLESDEDLPPLEEI
jgi:protein TilB